MGMRTTRLANRLRQIEQGLDRHGAFDLTEADVYWLIAHVRVGILAAKAFDPAAQAERLCASECSHSAAARPVAACEHCVAQALLEAFAAGSTAQRAADAFDSPPAR